MKVASVDYWSSKLFNLIHQNNLVYNTCWEDPDLDREALQLRSTDKILMITSAGCNALDYALTGPSEIFAVDMNPRQNALLELKIAGIKALDYETFFCIFGRGSHKDFRKIYTGQLRPLLTVQSREYWDRRTSYFAGKEGRTSFYFRGTSGSFARILKYYFAIFQIREHLEAIFSAKSVSEQAKIYHEYIRGALWTPLTKLAVSFDASLSLLGVPRPQRQELERTYQGGIARFIEDAVEAVFTRLPLSNNYFWWLYFRGEYTVDRCPRYLERENFDSLKSGAVDCIRTHTGSLISFLENSRTPISRFVLLDHMDWLSTYNQPILKDEWKLFIDRASPDARFIWRSGGLSSDFIDRIEHSHQGRSRRVGDILQYHKAWAAELHQRDRVHTYGSFHIADLVAA